MTTRARANVQGKSTDGVFYSMPLVNSGAAVAIFGSVTSSDFINSAYEFGQISATGGTVTTIAISMTSIRTVLLQSHVNNSQTVYIGGSASSITGIQLLAGDSMTLEYDDSTTSLFVFCSATSLVNYAAFK